MKRFVALLGGLALLGAAGFAGAVPFSDKIDFSGSGTDNGTTYRQLDGNGESSIYTYTHTIALTDFDPDLASWTNVALTDAKLSLRHKDNSNTYSGGPGGAEVWFLEADRPSPQDNLYIGRLSNSTSGWTIDEFALSAPILALMTNGTPWDLTIKFYEDTSNHDYLKIDYSVLSGNASVAESPQVPEPGTMMLLGTGLLGLAGYGRRRMR